MAKYVWLVKDEMCKFPIIKLDILKKKQAYKGRNNSCRLCLEENLCILEHGENIAEQKERINIKVEIH